MYSFLYKYLLVNKRLELPGIGCFYIRSTAATTDIVHKQVTPPVHSIQFEENGSVSDEQLSRFVDKETGGNAGSNTKGFLQKLSGELAEKNVLELPLIGTITKSNEGLSFTHATNHARFFTPVAAERIIREDSEHHILVGDAVRTNTQMLEHFDTSSKKSARDYWWVYAIVLAVIALAMIAYYHWQQQSTQQFF